MGKWLLTCPNQGKYECEGYYKGGHGEPFSLHCDTIKTLKGPQGGSCVDAPVDGSREACIADKTIECCGKMTKDYSKCMCDPREVCGA